jgi:hypothetical protein
MGPIPFVGSAARDSTKPNDSVEEQATSSKSRPQVAAIRGMPKARWKGWIALHPGPATAPVGVGTAQVPSDSVRWLEEDDAAYE